jgi:hypothetical protein
VTPSFGADKFFDSIEGFVGSTERAGARTKQISAIIALI